jgi:lantibiotic modifying enzyme
MGEMHPAEDRDRHRDALTAAREALRWVTDSGIAVGGGMTWPETRVPGAQLTDDLYASTAGILAALAEAKLTGLNEFDDYARRAGERLRSLEPAIAGTGARVAAAGLVADSDVPDLSLYTGYGGVATALRMWALASGDARAHDGARAVVRKIAAIVRTVLPRMGWRDLLSGQAGVLLVLTQIGDASVWPVAADIAGQLIAEAQWIDGLPEWCPRADDPVFLPNFSHGLAGIGFALAAASGPLGRPDLLEIAVLAGRRLIQLGARPDGTMAVPHSIPLADPQAPVSYGWCHGPTGTLRLFELLDRKQPAVGWARYAQACRQAVRSSGLPARKYPGFWDNLGQCCGTAGVGEMALDRYQQTGDEQWLAWAESLAADILSRSIRDKSGVRWSHTEHRRNPPDLEPSLGWMQGAAGIAGWLLRLCRVQRDGTGAATTWWPDRPVSAHDDDPR